MQQAKIGTINERIARRGAERPIPRVVTEHDLLATEIIVSCADSQLDKLLSKIRLLEFLRASGPLVA